jgi:hypothetical protein
MTLLDNVKGLLNQYASGATPSGDVSTHFQQVTQAVDGGMVAQGIAAALRSDQTPPFAQLASQLFASGSGDQKMAMLNTLLSSISPAQRGQLAALIPGLGAGTAVTSAQAATISPAAVQSLAQHAEQHNSGIVDKMSALYAAHPTLVKALGTGAMMIAMRTIAERHQSNA